MATVIKSRKAQFLMLVEDGASAEVINFTELVTAITTPTASITTADVTSFDDDVDILLTVGSDPGAYSFSLLDTSAGAGAVKLKDLLKNRGKRARLLISKTDGPFTAPSSPTLTAGVLSWTLPVGPYAYSFVEQEVEIQATDMVLANKEVFRLTMNVKAISALREFYKGDSAQI